MTRTSRIQRLAATDEGHFRIKLPGLFTVPFQLRSSKAVVISQRVAESFHACASSPGVPRAWRLSEQAADRGYT
jgi:hypothetical protein